MNKGVLIGVIAAIVFGVGGFWGGMTYAQNRTQAGRGQFAAGGANFAGRGGAGGATFARGGGGVFGTIISKDASSITVQLIGGPNATSSGQTGTGTKIVFFNDSTQIGKMTAGTPTDLSVGTNVTVAGTANSDGSVTANSIQIRPAGQGPRGVGQ